MSDDPSVVAGALRKSEAGLIEVSEDATKIRRLKPIPEINDELKREIALRTVYCKGFNKSATLDELLEFLKKFEGVESVKMRYYGSKEEPHFKGTALVEFKRREEAEAFLKQENVKYEDVSLFRQWYDDWSAEKGKSFSQKEAMKKEKYDRKEKEKENLIKELTEATEHGSIIHIADLDKSVAWNNIKDKFKTLVDPTEIKFVDTIDKDGKVAAYVRLTNAEKAKEVKEKIGDIIKIDGFDGKVSILEGNAEKEYLETAIEKRVNAKSGKGDKPGGKRSFRGGRQRGGRPFKRQKV